MSNQKVCGSRRLLCCCTYLMSCWVKPITACVKLLLWLTIIKNQISYVPVSASGSDNTQQALRGLLCMEKDKRTERQQTNQLKLCGKKIKQAWKTNSSAFKYQSALLRMLHKTTVGSNMTNLEFNGNHKLWIIQMFCASKNNLIKLNQINCLSAITWLCKC